MGLTYLDACILIYALEDQGPRGDAVRQTIAAERSKLVTSALSITECLVGPMLARDFELRDHYLAMFRQIELIEVTTDAFIRAAELRADFGLKTPDALHLAVAQLAGCEQLWTNDTRLATASRGLAVDVVNR